MRLSHREVAASFDIYTCASGFSRSRHAGHKPDIHIGGQRTLKLSLNGRPTVAAVRQHRWKLLSKFSFSLHNDATCQMHHCWLKSRTLSEHVIYSLGRLFLCNHTVCDPYSLLQVSPPSRHCVLRIGVRRQAVRQQAGTLDQCTDRSGDEIVPFRHPVRRTRQHTPIMTGA